MKEQEIVRARVLVKAYPQPSEQYEETVCVAAVSEDGSRLLRLYPIRFRHLDHDQRFTRFDLIQAKVWQDSRDGRPESYKVVEDSLQVLNGKRLNTAEKIRLWHPHVSDSYAALQAANASEEKTSLGIIKPDPESIQFHWERIEDVGAEEQRDISMLYKQQSLIDKPLKPLPAPEYAFRYRFTSAGHKHFMKIHDWEVQATYHSYVRTYGGVEQALAKMREQYEVRMPKQNLHLIMGTIKRHPHQFIIIGVLRTTEDVKQATAQIDLDL